MVVALSSIDTTEERGMRRKVGLSLMFMAVIPLAVASAAWACGVLATLKLNTSVASPGQSVTAVGVNYSTRAGASPVAIHLMTRTGKVVATTVPTSSGAIDVTFPIPHATRPGRYVVQATQFNPDGTPKAGTPGRTTLRIKGSGKAGSARKAAAVSPWGASTPARPGSPNAAAHASSSLSSPGLVPMLLAVVLSLTLLASGLTLAGRRKRTTGQLQAGI